MSAKHGKGAPHRGILRGIPDAPDSQARLQAILTAELDAIIVIDERGAIESVNPAFTQLFGYEPKEVVGRNVAMLMPEPYAAEHDRYLEHYIRTGQRKIIGIGREVEGQRKGGAIFPMHLAVSEMELSGRRMFTGVVRDLSEDKRRDEELVAAWTTARRYLEVASVCMVALDREGRVTMANPKACETLGVREADVLGKDWFARFVPKLDREAVRRIFDRLVAGELEAAEFYENSVLGADGAEIPIEWHNIPLRDESGRVTGTLSSGIDQREKKKLLARLIEKESLAKLGELSAIVAHEVKNPLAGIISGVRMVLKRLPTESSFEREVLEEIVTTTEDLSRVVRDMLTYSRPRSPTKRVVPAKLLLEDLISSATKDPVFDGVEVSLRGGDVLVECDVEMLKPVFLNILQNAAQAMGGGGRIHVALEHRNSHCRVSIEDSGPGIPQASLARIFEPFFTTKARGTGLGLPIAKRVIELHDGRISIDCPPEAGTRVVIELPSATGAGAVPRPAGREEPRRSS